MRFLAMLSCAATALAVAAAPVPKAPQPDELIKNGSFEDGPKNELLVGLPAKSEAVTGWTVTRGGVDYVGPFWDHKSGNRSIDLHASPGYGGIRQAVPTVKGAKYTLTFYLSGTPGCAKPKKTMAVGVDNAVTKFTCDSTGKRATDWQKQTLTFTAAGTETVIEFYTLETEDPNCGPAIDAVSVVRAK